MSDTIHTDIWRRTNAVQWSAMSAKPRRNILSRMLRSLANHIDGIKPDIARPDIARLNGAIPVRLDEAPAPEGVNVEAIVARIGDVLAMPFENETDERRIALRRFRIAVGALYPLYEDACRKAGAYPISRAVFHRRLIDWSMISHLSDRR